MSKPLRPAGGGGTVAGLQRIMRENGVAGACIVQTTTFYNWDNSFLLDAAKANPKWTAGVCTISPDDPHAPGLLLKYASECGVRALRSYTAANGRLEDPGVSALWKACADSGVVVNVRVWQKSTDELGRMLETFRRLPVVIDHCLYLEAGLEHDAILAHLIRLAKFPNAHAKLTFLPTGSAEPYPFRDMHESCRKIIAAYTPDRCVWGSNYPNELWTPKCTYGEHLRLFTEVLGLPALSKEAILHKTARRLYFRGKL